MNAIKNDLSVLLIAATLASCGLEEIITLPSPIANIAASTNVKLVFDGPANPSDDFLGFDFFYRIYTTTETADADVAKLALKLETSDPEQAINLYLINSGGLKYSKVALPGADGSIAIAESPAILVPLEYRSSSYSLSINRDIDNELSLDLSSIGVTGPVRLYRSGQNPETRLFRSFSEKPLAGAADYAGTATSSIVFIQFLVASYGFNVELIKNVYSEPISLALIRLE